MSQYALQHRSTDKPCYRQDSVSDEKVTVDVAYNQVKKGQNIYNHVRSWQLEE